MPSLWEQRFGQLFEAGVEFYLGNNYLCKARKIKNGWFEFGQWNRTIEVGEP